MIQVIRRGAECWEITSVEKIDGAYHHETIARVIRDAALYYVEFIDWKEETHVWRREGRGYLLPEPAFKVAIKGPKKPEVQ